MQTTTGPFVGRTQPPLAEGARPAGRQRVSDFRWRAILAAASLSLLTACGIAGAGALADDAIQAQTTAAPTEEPAPAPTAAGTEAGPETANPETANPETADPENGTTVDEVVDGLLVALGETGYYGECPTLESTGLDPLSLEANTALVEMTKTRHCAWVVDRNDDAVTLALDRLDIFGDENLYYVALSRSGADWALTGPPDRPAMGTAATPNSVWLDDLL